MASVRRIEWLSVEDYLVGEQAAEVRHEYVAGAVYAMGGSTARHNLLALGLAARVHAHLSGSPCETFISDIKVRSADAFYYPDVVVTCQPVAPDAVYLTEPTMIVEVLSESTDARDRLEKWTAYRAVARAPITTLARSAVSSAPLSRERIAKYWCRRTP
ncbi:MAG: Uma2 family endonuclease [Gammaproteobacteria bacterium]|nr:Uma2 family endonuclease [Gammaproteobacteria bacterium]